MKEIFLLAVVATFALQSCNNDKASAKINEENANPTEQQTDAPTGFAQISVDKEEHDFGELKKGDKAETEFTITNTGDADLVIIDVRATCGCTVPQKPEQPIKPGESDKIKVTFSATSVGMQNKAVTMTTNTEEGTKVVRVKANVTE